MSCGGDCKCDCENQNEEVYPLMICQNCGWLQTFSRDFVKKGKAVGWCDHCGDDRNWKEKLPRKIS